MAKATPTDVAKTVLNKVPEAKALLQNEGISLQDSSLQEIMPPVIEDPFTFNKFLTKLYNMIILQEVINGRFNNPLNVLKKGNMGVFGDTIERLIFNPAKAISYFDTKDNILTPAPPDIKVEYIQINRQDKYRVSIPRALAQQAFMGDNSFGEFMTGAMNSLYNGDTIDEYHLILRIAEDMVNQGYLLTENRAATSIDYTKQIINATKYFTFPNTKYNMYSQKYPQDAVTTWCDPSNIVIVARADAITDLKVDVLAAAFNLSEIELTSNIIEVDQFGDSQISCVVSDKGFWQVRDQLYEVADFWRADDLSTKSYLHHWQAINCSLFAKALAFIDPNL